MSRKTKIKKLKNHIRTKSYIFIMVMLIILASIAYLSFTYLKTNEEPTANEKTYTIQGQVTEKRTSCGSERLSPDGTVKRSDGWCDGGNHLLVDGVSISTGGGALTINPPKYISDITSIHAGDRVKIKYILKNPRHDGNRTKSTDCESCYVQKEGQPKQKQQLVER